MGVKKEDKKWKKKGTKEHVTNIKKMMKTLPRGQGLVKAFNKIEAEKKKPNKNFLKNIGRKKFKRQVKKMEGKKPDVSGLTRAARKVVNKTARDKKFGSPSKKKKSVKKMVKMAKKIEETHRPGKSMKGV